MAVETAEDLASFFDDDEFAEAASYLAPGLGALPVDCLVILDLGQGREVFAGGEQRVATSERHLWVRKSVALLCLPEVQRGGTFSILDPEQLALDPPVRVVSEVLRVEGLPKLDHTGKLWSVQLVIRV